MRASGAAVITPNPVQTWAPRNDPVACFVGGYPCDAGVAAKAMIEVYNTGYSVHSSGGTGAVGSVSNDVNRPISYSNIDIDQLNQVNAPRTQSNLMQQANMPVTTPATPQPNPLTALQAQTQQQSNGQMNGLLQDTANAQQQPIRMTGSAYQKLLELKAFMNALGNK